MGVDSMAVPDLRRVLLGLKCKKCNKSSNSNSNSKNNQVTVT